MAQRTCSTPGCDKSHRAKGLCSSCYNRRYDPGRHRRSKICERCGKPYETTRSDGRFCSLGCRDEWRHATRFPIVVYWGLPGGVPSCEIPLAHPCRSQTFTAKRIWTSGPCGWCGGQFVAVSFNLGRLARFCSTACRKAAHKYARGRFVIHDAVRLAIYDRDGWICQLCGDGVEQGLPPSDIWGATLDHIVPRSKGGSDDPENLRLAHRWCNSVRGDDTYYAAADLAA